MSKRQIILQDVAVKTASTKTRIPSSARTVNSYVPSRTILPVHRAEKLSTGIFATGEPLPQLLDGLTTLKIADGVPDKVALA